MAREILKGIWPEWELGKRIGGGSYGVVYEAVRKVRGVESHAAIKIISIPANESELDSLLAEGMDLEGSRRYLQGLVDDFVGEIQMMETLQGSSNIVNVTDYQVVEKTGEMGWYIFIRMELLTPLSVYLCDKKLSEEEVIKLGCDICTALDICHRQNILHRDIKPGNIMVHKTGDFKLGDFGIARSLENATIGMSRKYSPNYVAPEVLSSTRYDGRVDIYSLGLVLYRMMNGDRLPFLEAKQLRGPGELNRALERRIRGEALPAPCEASPELAAVILRACAFDPGDRYATAGEMKAALLGIGRAEPAAENGQEPAELVSELTAIELEGTFAVRRPDEEEAPAAQVVEDFDEFPAEYTEKTEDDEPIPADDIDEMEKTVPASSAAANDRTMAVRRAAAASKPVPEPVMEPDEILFTEEQETPRRNRTGLSILAILIVAAAALFAVTIIRHGLWSERISLTKIEVNTEQTKTTYVLGETLDKESIELIATYSDGSTKSINREFTCTPMTLSETGTQIVTVSYGGEETSFHVLVQNKAVTEIAIQNEPAKMTYYVDETLDTAGLTLKLIYNDGSTEIISSGFTCSPTTLRNAGTQTVTVRYGTVTTSYKVTVQEKTVAGISIRTMPKKTTYFVGETLNTSGLTLTATYNDGSTETISSGFTCDPSVLNTVGTQTVTVSYGGKSAHFSVTIEEVFVTGITLSRRVYSVGEALDTSGTLLRVTYNNGETKTITSGFTCVPAVLNKTGTQTVKVNYGGFVENVNIEVLDFSGFDAEIYNVYSESFNKNARVYWVMCIRVSYNGNYFDPIFVRNMNFDERYRDESGWKDEWDWAKSGKSTSWSFVVAEHGFGEYYGGGYIILPDDPDFAGDYSASVIFGDLAQNVTFTLVYNGDYKTGTGWSITNIHWSQGVSRDEH